MGDRGQCVSIKGHNTMITWRWTLSVYILDSQGVRSLSVLLGSHTLIATFGLGKGMEIAQLVIYNPNLLLESLR